VRRTAPRPVEIPDFVPVAAAPPATIERYRGRVPDRMIELWQMLGYGAGVSGFIKLIDPDLYREQIGDSLHRASMIPLFATGMADVIVWDEVERKNRILRYRYGRFNAFLNDIDLLLTDFADPAALAEDYLWAPYPEAVARYGAPAFDECFAYTPLLALGGPEKVEHLEKAKLTTHIALITQLAGPIPYY
jgi:hypothetical protein